MEHDVWRLPSRLNALSINRLRQKSLYEIAVSGDWFFDLREVSEIDQTGLDWLLAVRNRVVGSGFRLFFLNTPCQFSRIIRLLERDQIYPGRRSANA
ncbi:STAS domain-containing protein [Marinobacter adhaerens]|jgi:anti-anti-sigma regulatory factor|uniref:STAS domain-containing protein n=1 Tax=Marinobacter adhaerens TaxID=1033846 RepID=UPI003AF38F14